jgi:hypothetical protein
MELKKMDRLRLYLAHPFPSRESVRSKELDIETRYPWIELFNPFYDCPRDEIKKIDDGTIDRWSADTNVIVTRDLTNLFHSDGYVGVVDGQPSIGTIMELVYATTYMCEPRIVLNTNGTEKHYWLKYHATKIVTSWEDLEAEFNALHP